MTLMIPSVARLRPVPTGDPRPDLDSDSVLDRSLLLYADPLRDWARGKVPLNLIGEDGVLISLKAAIRNQGPDAFRVGWALKEAFNWPVNTDLVMLLHRCFLTLAESRRIEVAAWAVRCGMRFSGEKGDTVEWIDIVGDRKAGTVYGLVQKQAGAWVTRASDDAHEWVPAECLVGNITQSLYGEQPVILGATYEDAEALAAAATFGSKRKTAPIPDPGPPAAA